MVNENQTPVEPEKVSIEEKRDDVNGNDVNAKEPKEVPKAAAAEDKTKTVQELIDKVKNDTNMTNTSKMDTLAILVMRFVEENSELQNEATMVKDQMKKHKEAKDAIKALNEFLKKQIGLVKQESALRLEEEQSKREQSMGGYQTTMNELSGLLEDHQGKNSSLKDQNGEMADQMLLLVNETEKREGHIERMQMENQLRLKLLEHQVAKAQIEKSEVKAEMTKDRLELMKELAAVRDKNQKLDETVQLLRQQAEIYQKQMGELQKGSGDSTKSFDFFKSQIEKLTNQMVQLEKESSQWKEKSDVSSGQVAKMSLSAMDKDKEMILIKSKLESMIKLNKTLSTERSELLGKLKQGAD